VANRIGWTEQPVITVTEQMATTSLFNMMNLAFVMPGEAPRVELMLINHNLSIVMSKYIIFIILSIYILIMFKTVVSSFVNCRR
jgi:hypothetical protein